MLRKNKELDTTQLEHFRIVAEKRLFKNPKLKIYFSYDPFTEEFFSKNEYEKYT
jgi:hypothetical protein